MAQYKHILVAVDLLPHSKKTINHAISIAKQNDAALYLVHVMEHSPAAYGGEFSVPIDANLEQTLEHEAGLLLSDFAKEHHIPEKNLFIENGSVKVAINKVAKNIKADLIVVGSHNHHGLEILLGSRANAIMHLAKCDVWVVKNQ